MAKKRFTLDVPIKAVDDTDLALKEYYRRWRSNNTLTNAAFAPIFSSFKEKHLKDMESGPLQLYLYFAFAADNKYGYSWHSISKIAGFFDKQTRTIDNWIKVLVDRELIYREQKGNKSHNTYLIPYSDTIIPHTVPGKREKDEQVNFNKLVSKLKGLQFLYGEIIKVFHFFQWGSSKGQPESNKNFQWIFLITRRKNDVLIGHICRLKHYDHLSIDTLDAHRIPTFQSPLKFAGTPVIGLALQHDIPLENDSSVDALMDLLQKLAVLEDEQLEERSSVQYGEKNMFFPFPSGAQKENTGNEENAQNGE